MKEEKSVDWDQLPKELWHNIAVYLPAQNNQLYHFLSAHPMISKKINQDYRWIQRKNNAIIESSISHTMRFFRSTHPEDHDIEAIKSEITPRLELALIEEQSIYESKLWLYELLFNPDQHAEISRMKASQYKHTAKIYLSDYHRTQQMIISALLTLECVQLRTKPLAVQDLTVIEMIKRQPDLLSLAGKHANEQFGRDFVCALFGSLGALALALVLLSLMSAGLYSLAICYFGGSISILEFAKVTGLCLVSFSSDLSRISLIASAISIFSGTAVGLVSYLSNRKSFAFVSEARDYFNVERGQDLTPLLMTNTA